MPFNRPIPESKPPAGFSSALASLTEAEKLMQIAFVLPAAAFIGWLAGAWLDKHLHQEWIAVAGILFGGVAGLVYVVRLGLASAAKAAGGAGSSGDPKSGGPGEGGSGIES